MKLTDWVKPYQLKPNGKVSLKSFDPREKSGWNKTDASDRLALNTARIDELSYKLYAENRRSLLIVLQGMDTAGKDGTIRAVMRGLDPSSCQVKAFKQPSVTERDHDFLWRIHQNVPARGNIGIFNRSHYEDVLVVRVHGLVEPQVWQSRYRRINEFEALVSEGGVTILKFFLHISEEEQLERLQARLNNPHKRWKFSKADVSERKLWDAYQLAYEDALSKCGTDVAPWYLIPADRKWHRNLVVSEIVKCQLESIDPQFPPCEEGLDEVKLS